MSVAGSLAESGPVGASLLIGHSRWWAILSPQPSVSRWLPGTVPSRDPGEAGHCHRAFVDGPSRRWRTSICGSSGRRAPGPTGGPRSPDRAS